MSFIIMPMYNFETAVHIYWNSIEGPALMGQSTWKGHKIICLWSCTLPWAYSAYTKLSNQFGDNLATAEISATQLCDYICPVSREIEYRKCFLINAFV